MAQESLTFNVQEIEVYKKQLQSAQENILEAFKEIDEEIDRVFQGEINEVGLKGTLSKKIINAWENNRGSINNFENIFSQWILTLEKIQGVGAELALETSSLYTK